MTWATDRRLDWIDDRFDQGYKLNRKDFDNRCESAWVDSQSGEPPVTMDEQHRAAWAQKQALRR